MQLWGHPHGGADYDGATHPRMSQRKRKWVTVAAQFLAVPPHKKLADYFCVSRALVQQAFAQLSKNRQTRVIRLTCLNRYSFTVTHLTCV